MLPRQFCLGLVAICLCRFAYAGPDQWIEVQSGHFTVVTDTSEKQGRHIADQFERMRWVFQTLFPTANVDPAESTVVIAARNEKVFQTMEPAAYLAKGQIKLGGYYSHTQEKNYILLQLDTQYDHPFATVYHEYTHLQFSFAAAWLPLWLNEGLAEFMQNTEIRDKSVLLGEASPDDIYYLRQNQLIPLNVLFKIDAKSPYYHEEQKGSVFYAEAWALTHFLMAMDYNKHTNRIGDYMNLVSQSEDPVVAAEKTFGDLQQLQKGLEDYIHLASYKEYELSTAGAAIDESTFKARPLTQVEIDARRADVLSYVNRESEARALLDAILKEDPNNVQAHETMGSLELRAGHRDEAWKWYGEAIKLGSMDYLAYYYFASISMSQPPEPNDKAIEDSLRMAIHLNPQFAPSYDRLAVFYTMRNENLAQAHLLSVQAIQLDPGQVVFRENSANVLMAMQRYDDALAVLRAAEKVARNPGQVSHLQFQIEQAERHQRDREEAEAYGNAKNSNAAAGSNGGTEVVTMIPEERPKHPDAEKNAPKHTAVGVIHAVVCSYPTVVEFELDATAGKKFSLYNNVMQSIDLSAFGFTPSGTMNPCKDFEGRKAKVEFLESPDKSMDGQVITIELRK